MPSSRDLHSRHSDIGELLPGQPAHPGNRNSGRRCRTYAITQADIAIAQITAAIGECEKMPGWEPADPAVPDRVAGVDA